MKKGLIFTLDATIAIIVATAFILSIIFYISKVDVATHNNDMHRQLMDSLAVLEKNGALKDSVTNVSSLHLQDFIAGLPTNTCAEILIIDQTETVIKTATKAGCTQPQEFLIVRRVFLVNRQAYLAKMEGWYT